MSHWKTGGHCQGKELEVSTLSQNLWTATGLHEGEGAKLPTPDPTPMNSASSLILLHPQWGLCLGREDGTLSLLTQQLRSALKSCLHIPHQPVPGGMSLQIQLLLPLGTLSVTVKC